MSRPTREQRRDRANAIWLCGTVLGVFAASGIGALIYGAANAPAPAVTAAFSIPIALAIVARFAYIGILSHRCLASCSVSKSYTGRLAPTELVSPCA